jgi:urease accessory protein
MARPAAPEEPEGLLELELDVGPSGRTVLTRRAQRFPLHLTAPLYLDPGDPGLAFLYLQNASGGMFGGDRVRIGVAVRAGARAHLTTPSATKLYRTTGDAARHVVALEVDERAWLEYLPEPLIPHAGGALEQELTAVVADTAVLLVGERLAPGRLARGEAFEYERLLLSTRVLRGGAELVVDALDLQPARLSPRRRGLLGRFPYLVSLLAVAAGADALADRVDDAVRSVPGTLAAAGPLPNDAGVLARVLATSPSVAAAAANAAWAVLRGGLLGLPLPPYRK